MKEVAQAADLLLQIEREGQDLSLKEKRREVDQEKNEDTDLLVNLRAEIERRKIILKDLALVVLKMPEGMKNINSKNLL